MVSEFGDETLETLAVIDENEPQHILPPPPMESTIVAESAVQEVVDRYVRSLSPSEAAVFFHSLALSTGFMAAASQNPNTAATYINNAVSSMGSVAATTPTVQNTSATAVRSSN